MFIWCWFLSFQAGKNRICIFMWNNFCGKIHIISQCGRSWVKGGAVKLLEPWGIFFYKWTERRNIWWINHTTLRNQSSGQVFCKMVLFFRVARKLGRIHNESCCFSKIHLLKIEGISTPLSTTGEKHKMTIGWDLRISFKEEAKNFNAVSHENKGKNSHELGKEKFGILSIDHKWLYFW